MQSVTKALDRILRQHEPFPALVMDRSDPFSLGDSLDRELSRK